MLFFGGTTDDDRTRQGMEGLDVRGDHAHEREVRDDLLTVAVTKRDRLERVDVESGDELGDRAVGAQCAGDRPREPGLRGGTAKTVSGA